MIRYFEVNSPMKMKPPKSIPDQIYDYLMESIQTGEIMDGERLIETRVAEALQISRTPVREAFRRLEQDGIVERLPQGGVRVVPITSAMIEELFGIRGVLEAYAADLACERITPEAIEELERIKQLALSAIDNRDLPRDQKMKQLFELNTMFSRCHLPGNRQRPSDPSDQHLAPPGPQAPFHEHPQGQRLENRLGRSYPADRPPEESRPQRGR